MRKFCYIFIFFIFCLSTKAQKYGVSIGYAYSYGKAEYRPDMINFYNYLFGTTNFKFKFFPNAFVRPYIRLYKQLNFFAGAEITQYEINYLRTSSAVGYWDKKVKQTDFHFPLGLKINLLSENKKYSHAVYGGGFFIYHFKGREWLNDNNSANIGISRPEGFEVNPNITIVNNQKINLIVGYEFGYKLKEWFSLSSNLFLKYMPIYLDYSSPTTTGLFPTTRNKFSFSISLGCSFMKPPKQKEEEASKVFRLDD